MLRSRRARVRPCSCREHAHRLRARSLSATTDRAVDGRQRASGFHRDARRQKGAFQARALRSAAPHHRRGDPVTASGAATSGDRELRPPCRFPSPAPTPSQWQTRSAPTSARPTPPADVYLLSKVLNNWPDRETTAILTRCAEAGRPWVSCPRSAAPCPAPPGPSPSRWCAWAERPTPCAAPAALRHRQPRRDDRRAGPSGRFVVECRRQEA